MAWLGRLLGDHTFCMISFFYLIDMLPGSSMPARPPQVCSVDSRWVWPLILQLTGKDARMESRAVMAALVSPPPAPSIIKRSFLLLFIPHCLVASGKRKQPPNVLKGFVQGLCGAIRAL